MFWYIKTCSLNYLGLGRFISSWENTESLKYIELVWNPSKQVSICVLMLFWIFQAILPSLLVWTSLLGVYFLRVGFTRGDVAYVTWCCYTHIESDDMERSAACLLDTPRHCLRFKFHKSVARCVACVWVIGRNGVDKCIELSGLWLYDACRCHVLFGCWRRHAHFRCHDCPSRRSEKIIFVFFYFLIQDIVDNFLCFGVLFFLMLPHVIYNRIIAVFPCVVFGSPLGVPLRHKGTAMFVKCARVCMLKGGR